ncbi:hypothetical protein MTO96_042849 [Rhipicephalus appendiculatus]
MAGYRDDQRLASPLSPRKHPFTLASEIVGLQSKTGTVFHLTWCPAVVAAPVSSARPSGLAAVGSTSRLDGQPAGSACNSRPRRSTLYHLLLLRRYPSLLDRTDWRRRSLLQRCGNSRRFCTLLAGRRVQCVESDFSPGLSAVCTVRIIRSGLPSRCRRGGSERRLLTAEPSRLSRGAMPRLSPNHWSLGLPYESLAAAGALHVGWHPAEVVLVDREASIPS